MMNDHFCEKFCHCSTYCEKRFPGCSCPSGGCTANTCICVKALRECDPDICKTCVCTIQINILKRQGKELPKTSNICKNIDMMCQRKRKLFVGKSKVCPGLGLYSGEVIEKEEYICLYSGEIITDADSENRGIIQDAIEETYLFNLNSQYVVDASKVGNIMRYSNHASGAHVNAVPKVITYVRGDQMVGLYATRRIEIGQEILFDYNFKKDFEWLKAYKEKYASIAFDK